MMPKINPELETALLTAWHELRARELRDQGAFIISGPGAVMALRWASRCDHNTEDYLTLICGPESAYGYDFRRPSIRDRYNEDLANMKQAMNLTFLGEGIVDDRYGWYVVRA